MARTQVALSTADQAGQTLESLGEGAEAEDVDEDAEIETAHKHTLRLQFQQKSMNNRQLSHHLNLVDRASLVVA